MFLFKEKAEPFFFFFYLSLFVSDFIAGSPGDFFAEGKTKFEPGRLPADAEPEKGIHSERLRIADEKNDSEVTDNGDPQTQTEDE